MTTPLLARPALLILVAILVFSAGSSRAELRIIETDTSAFPEVSFSLTASGTTNCSALGADLLVTEDGVPVTAEVNVEASSDERTLVIVLSNAGYLSRSIDLQRAVDQATALIDRLDPGDRVGLLRYGGCNVDTVTPTTDHAAVIAEIAASHAIGGGIVVDALYLGIEMACDAGGGSVVYIGEGIENASSSCDLAPTDGFGGDDSLADDRATLIDLAACGVSVSSIGIDAFNVAILFQPLASATGGLFRADEVVTDVDRDAMLDAGGGSAGCTLTVTYTSPAVDADGSTRTVEVCASLLASCDEFSYTAECVVAVEPDATTRAAFTAACVPEGARNLGVMITDCADILTAELTLTDAAGDETFALAADPSDPTRWSVTVGADLLQGGRTFGAVFEVATGDGVVRVPVTGDFTLTVCDEGGEDPLTVSLPVTQAAPGTTVELPLTLSGDGLRFVASVETRLVFDPTVLEIVAVDDEGTVADQAGWLAPVWAVAGNELRIAQAGSGPLPGVGVLARITARVRDDAAGFCSDLDLVESIFNDGDPIVLLEDGQVCAGPGCVQGRVVLWSDEDAGIEGFDVLRAADGVVIATTDAEGWFSICPAPALPLRVTLVGENADGDLVSPFDAALVLQASVGIHDPFVPSVERTCESATDTWSPRAIAADASGDGVIGAFDASLILQWLVAQIDVLPAGRWAPACSSFELVAGVENNLAVVRIGDVSSGADALTREALAIARWSAADVRGMSWDLDVEGPVASIDVQIADRIGGVRVLAGDPWVHAVGNTERGVRAVLARGVTSSYGSIRFLFDEPFDPSVGSSVVLDDRIVIAGVEGRPGAPTQLSWSVHVEGEEGVRIAWTGAPIGGSSGVDVFDLRGRRIARIPIADRDGSVLWNTTDDHGHRVANGVYFVRMAIEGQPRDSRKILLLGR